MQTIIQQPARSPEGILIRPWRIPSKLWYAMAIPSGYEDETGFHLGTGPAKNSARSTAAKRPPWPDWPRIRARAVNGTEGEGSAADARWS